MFQISGDAISGIVVGFVLGVIAYRFYDRLIYEVVEEGEKPIRRHLKNKIQQSRKVSQELTAGLVRSSHQQ